ncbi:MAG: hypothetical protein IPJ08_22200 [Burkholderiales bacterium]|nr:hypothetical protein [Burkholderiales bacterium]
MDRIERAICKKIEPLLKQHGFSLHKEWGYFVRVQPYGHDALLVVNKGTAGVGPRHFEINTPCGIRHDRIEIPWNTLGMVYGEGQLQTDTLMLGFPRGMTAPTLKVMPATMDEDIARIAAETEAVFTKTALPFYERFADLRAIEELANKQPLADFMPYTVGLPIEHRGMRSLLLAKAVNPQRYPAVRETFIQLDKGMFPREKRLQMLQRVDEMVLPE